MKDLKTAAIIGASAMSLLVAGCNDDSTSGSSGFSDTPPENRTTARSSTTIEQDDVDGLSADFAGAFTGTTPGGTDTDTIAPLTHTAGATGILSANARSYVDELIQQFDLIIKSPQSITARSDDDFSEEINQSCDRGGSITAEVTKDSAFVHFDQCEIDDGMGGYSRITGRIDVDGLDGALESDDPDCFDNTSDVTFVADDVWFRSYNDSGQQIDSIFFSADFGFSATFTCDPDSFDSTLNGSHFFIDAGDEWFGMYDFDFTVSGDEEEVETSMEVTFDSSEASDGSMTLTTEPNFKQRLDEDYPYDGAIKIEAGGNSLTYDLHDEDADESTYPSKRTVGVEGQFGEESCSGSPTWNRMSGNSSEGEICS